MKETQTEQIRNTAIIAHGSAGKTSLTEAVLFNARSEEHTSEPSHWHVSRMPSSAWIRKAHV